MTAGSFYRYAEVVAHRLFDDGYAEAALDDIAVVTFTCPPCANDLTGDRLRSGADLAVVNAAHGRVVLYGAGADVDQSSTIDVADLAQLLAELGTSCP